MAVGNDLYVIERSADKYVKRLKGEETQEAKTNLEFTSYDMVQFDEMPEHARGNLNGIDRRETDKNIRKVFGTLDDFLFTSMTSQVGSLAFINEGSTRRKEILGKFLDLDVFAKKFRLANDDAAEIKGALRRLEGRDFDEEITQAEQDVKDNEKETEKHKIRCDLLKNRLQEAKNRATELEKQIASLPDLKIWDLDAAIKDLEELQQKEEKFSASNKELFLLLAEQRNTFAEIDKLLQDIDSEDLEEKKKLIFEKESELNRVLNEITQAEQKKERENKKTSLLKEVPCGDQFPECKFLVDAYAAKKEKPETEKLIKLLNSKRQEISINIDEIHPEHVDATLEQYNKLLNKRRELEVKISQGKLEVEKNNSKITTIRGEISSLKSEIEEYNKNREAAALFRKLNKQRVELQTEIKEYDEELGECEEEMLELYKSHGSLEHKLQSLEELKGELSDLRIQYAAYDLYEKCMHSNGISYDIIKKRLPVINEEIAKVLANVVNFEVFFEDDGKKLDILIKHPKYEPRPLELGSGAEKMLAAMAIRLSLIKISSLPQGDVFILDEPATALDEENMEGFIRIIEMLKSQFKTILIISHLDALKDIVDQQIVIEKSDGFAKVEV
jgi:exonuclease SbcC